VVLAQWGVISTLAARETGGAKASGAARRAWGIATIHRRGVVKVAVLEQGVKRILNDDVRPRYVD